ncbi:bifunctional phosphopantothenoylcysteine decarboxylase/phosphopantothenate--cysteine ligase CoaBC [Candidatus Harpocratesius sp.]
MNNNWQSQTHPTKDIQGITSSKLNGKRFCICLTGSVAVINAPTMARELMRHGAEVFTVMTKEATDLLQAELMEWATGNPVILDITGQIEHISMAGERENSKGFADMIIVYPATANTIGKMANGISDTAVTAIATVALGSKTPMIVVPAMHDSMYKNPIVKENIEKLRSLGVQIVDPRMEENKAKIATAEDVLLSVFDFIGLKTIEQDFQNRKILVTAGTTREWIDQVRFLSNPASGRMGIAIAKALVDRGANVVLLLGPSSLKPSPHPKLIVKHPISTQDFVNFASEVLKSGDYDILISAAALADFTPKQTYDGKITSDLEELQINLVSTPKLIQIARNIASKLFIVGFKAESQLEQEKIIENAYKRLKSSNINLIVANSVHPDALDRGFNAISNEVFIINPKKEIKHFKLASKIEIAHHILDCINSEISNF